MAKVTDTALGQESLFSLEVVVDTLTLADKTVCRFPAVAFRLLDFPTLLVYHVEPDLGQKIKIKIDADQLYKVPNQLPELQDRHGQFVIKKGKSCLFKVSPNTMQSHLNTTPLYVMIIDTYPEVPKLVASCTVPLDACFDDVYDDICKLGISVPSAHGEKSDYNICNLMGRDIGNITLGFRLLSLGVGLLPHIPESSVAKLQKRGVVHTEDGAKQNGRESEHVVLYDLETAEKPIQVSIAPEPRCVEDFQVQTESNILLNAATQTLKKKSKKQLAKQFEITSPYIQDEVDDFFVTNSECPPPLFFNSEKEVPLSKTLLLSYYPMGLPAHKPVSSESDSEEDSIRDEDIFSDSGTHIEPKKFFKPPKKDFTTNSIPKKSPAPQIEGSISQLPILNALLQEIMCLKGGGPQTDAQADDVKKVLNRIRPRSPRRMKTEQVTPRPVSPGRKQFEFPKESQDEFLSRIASPRHVPAGKPQPRPGSPPGTRKHICQAGHPEVVPATQAGTRNKGWLRHRQSAGVAKMKLQSGMTNTQRLRLAKTNPELLVTLERDENSRLEKRRERMEKKWGSHQLSSTGLGDVSTEITRHPSRDTGRVKVPLLDLSAVTDTRTHKKPVPTPRQSVNTKEYQDAMEDELPSITPRLHASKQQRYHHDDGDQMIPERDRREPADHSSGSEPQSSRIEVHIPSASAHNDDDSDATSVDDRELVSPRPAARTSNRARYNPGFPAQDSLELGEYSDDSDQQSSAVIDTAQLRRIIDKYSDDSADDRDETTLEGVSAGDELGLRCIVDKYSDDDSSDRSKQSSYHSAASKQPDNRRDGDKKLTMPSMLKPASSKFSPDTINESHGSRHQGPATRQPFTAVSVTDGMSNTQDSTAYLNRSQVSTQVSVDSNTTDSQPAPRTRYPKPSPRTPRTPRNISVRTDSISSYAPSDQENTSPVSPGTDYYNEYSDNFDDYSQDDEESEVIAKPKQMKDIELDPKAKLGYTWGYSN